MDEGRGAKEKGGACRWGPVHVSWEGDAKVGAGTHRRAALMGGGWHTKVGAGTRRWGPAHEGGGQHTKVGAGAQRWGPAHKGGGRRTKVGAKTHGGGLRRVGREARPVVGAQDTSVGGQVGWEELGAGRGASPYMGVGRGGTVGARRCVGTQWWA